MWVTLKPDPHRRHHSGSNVWSKTMTQDVPCWQLWMQPHTDSEEAFRGFTLLYENFCFFSVRKWTKHFHLSRCCSRVSSETRIRRPAFTQPRHVWARTTGQNLRMFRLVSCAFPNLDTGVRWRVRWGNKEAADRVYNAKFNKEQVKCLVDSFMWLQTNHLAHVTVTLDLLYYITLLEKVIISDISCTWNDYCV